MRGVSTYRCYQQARDTAWRALMHLPPQMPVDVEALARRAGAEVLTFPDREEQPRLWEAVRKAGAQDCVSLRVDGRWYLLIRERALDESQRRFAIAHELGHLLLRHGTRPILPGVRAFQSRENAGDVLDEPQSLDDYAADIFAVRLLAPACVLHALHVENASDIQRICGLPSRAAQLRSERMALLNDRDAYMTHPLERKVMAHFLSFVEESNRGAVAPPPAAGALPLAIPLPDGARERLFTRRLRPSLYGLAGVVAAAILWMLFR